MVSRIVPCYLPKRTIRGTLVLRQRRRLWAARQRRNLRDRQIGGERDQRGNLSSSYHQGGIDRSWLAPDRGTVAKPKLNPSQLQQKAFVDPQTIVTRANLAQVCYIGDQFRLVTVPQAGLRSGLPHLSVSAPSKGSASPSPSPSLETLVLCLTRWRPRSLGMTSSLRWTVMVVRLAPRRPSLRWWPRNSRQVIVSQVSRQS